MSFFDQQKQQEIYRLLKIDHSIEEINKRLFYEENRQFFFMKEKYKDKQKGLALRDNARINKFVEVNKKKPQEDKIKHPAKPDKRIPVNLNDADLQDLVLTQHVKKKINLI